MSKASWFDYSYRALAGNHLPRSINLTPATRRQQRPDACAEQRKPWSQYSFALVVSTHNHRWGTVINRNAGAESPARPNHRPDQRMLASMAVAFDRNPLNSLAGEASVPTSQAHHQRIVADRLKIALRRFPICGYDLDRLARRHLFQISPIRFLSRPQRWAGR